jgi:hypothetical protein
LAIFILPMTVLGFGDCNSIRNSAFMKKHTFLHNLRLFR